MNQKRTIDIISAILIILFLYTGISKLLSFNIFQIQLAESPLLKPYVGMVSTVVPITEIIISLLLLQKKTKRLGLYCSLTLLVLFTCYIIVMFTTYEHLPCTCGGIIQQLSWPAHLILNITLIIITGLAILFDKKYRDSLTTRPINML